MDITSEQPTETIRIQPATSGWCGTIGCREVADWEVSRRIDDTTWAMRLACDVHTTPSERRQIAAIMEELTS